MLDKSEPKQKSRPPPTEACFVPNPNAASIYPNHEPPLVPPYLQMNAPQAYNPGPFGANLASGTSDPRNSTKPFSEMPEQPWLMTEQPFSHAKEPMSHAKNISISSYFDAVRLTEEVKSQPDVSNFQPQPPPPPPPPGLEIPSSFPSDLHLSSEPTLLENQSILESHGVGPLADSSRSLNSHPLYSAPSYGPPFSESASCPPEHQYTPKGDQYPSKLDYNPKMEYQLKPDYHSRVIYPIKMEEPPKSYPNGLATGEMQLFHENPNLIPDPMFSPIQPDLQRQISHQLRLQLSWPQKPAVIQEQTKNSGSSPHFSGDPTIATNFLNATWTKRLWKITSVDVLNVNSYLLSFLREEGDDIPLDEFYNILYNFDKLHQYMETNTEAKIDKVEPKDTFDNSARLFHRILGVFRNPDQLRLYFPSAELNLSKVSSVNFYDLLRSFLALKILAATLVEVKDSKYVGGVPIIPRHTIYKVYYILCQMLILRYPGSNGSDTQKSIILGQSKLGKLLKLTFPTLKSKRLGRRGESKYNYLGVVWNKQVVEHSILDLCDLEQPQLNQTLRRSEALRASSKEKSKASAMSGSASSEVNPLAMERPGINSPGIEAAGVNSQSRRSAPGTNSPSVTSPSGINAPAREMDPSVMNPTPNAMNHMNAMNPMSPMNPMNPTTMSPPATTSPNPSWRAKTGTNSTFVRPNSMFPADMGSPRRGWMQKHLRRSVGILRPLGIDRTALDSMVDVSNMKTCDEWLFSRFCRCLDTLLASQPRQYLHLLLVVALLVLSRLAAAQGPVSALKTNIDHLALHLSAKYAHSSISPVLGTYTSMMRRMAHVHGLLDQLVHHRSAGLASAMASDVEALLALDSTHPFACDIMDHSPGMHSWSNLRRMVCDSMVYTACGRGFVFGSEDVVGRVDHAARHLERVVGQVSQKMLEDRLGGSATQYAQWVVQTVHRCLFVAEVVEYPVPIICGCCVFTTNQILSFLGAEHRRRGGGDDVMRYWWLLASFLSEYAGVVGEVVGLQQYVG